MQIQFKSRYLPQSVLVELVPTAYINNGNPALELVDPETKEPILMASVNPPELLEQSHEKTVIAIKDWSENEGVPEALIAAGILESEPPIYYISSGFVQIPVCRLTALGKSLFAGEQE